MLRAEAAAMSDDAVIGRPGRLWHRALRLLLLAQALGFAFMVAGTHGAFGPQPLPPTTTDFASFYAAGLLANRGTPALAYNETAHRAAEYQAIAPGVEEKRFVNPPVFLLICAPLARLPYLAAFTLFECATAVVWLALATRIAGGGATAAMALAAIPSVWWAIGWGQNSFLSASLMAAGTLLIRRQPLAAGAAFGALCFKPHLALLVPVALIAGRHWRALASAATTSSALVAMSVLCFGLPTWQAFATALRTRSPVGIEHGLTGHVDLDSAARLLGASPGSGAVLQALAFAASAAGVAWLWQRARQPGAFQTERAWRANAGLIAGTLAAAPFLLFYDLVIASIAAAWIARTARRRGWHRNDIGSLAASAVLDLIAFPAAILLHLAAGALVPPILLRLSLQRDVQTQSGVLRIEDGHHDDVWRPRLILRQLHRRIAQSDGPEW